jgi:hypothetical protein
MPFSGEWDKLIGQPERAVVGLYGVIAEMGKHLCTPVASYITLFTRVVYYSLEEGISESLKRSVILNGVVGTRKLILLDKEPIPELCERLKKHKSPNVIIVDSIQYSGINYKEYKALRDEFRNKHSYFLSHADGREPAGRTAKSIRYDANVKNLCGRL